MCFESHLAANRASIGSLILKTYKKCFRLQHWQDGCSRIEAFKGPGSEPVRISTWLLANVACVLGIAVFEARQSARRWCKCSNHHHRWSFFVSPINPNQHPLALLPASTPSPFVNRFHFITPGPAFPIFPHCPTSKHAKDWSTHFTFLSHTSAPPRLTVTPRQRHSILLSAVISDLLCVSRSLLPSLALKHTGAHTDIHSQRTPTAQEQMGGWWWHGVKNKDRC